MTKRFDIRYSTRPEFRLETLSKTDDGEKTKEAFEPPFSPYCYVEADDLERVTDVIAENDELKLDSEAPDGYCRVTGQVPWDIKEFDDEVDVETYEADVRYAKRVMIDEGLQVDIPDPEDILYFDIEVDPRGEFPDPDDAQKQVLSIAAVGGDGEEYFFCYDDEERVLRKFIDLLDEYFVVVGWNSATFDWPYLKNRLTQFPFSIPEFEIIHLDLQYLFMHINREERQTFALDAVGEDEVGMGKTMSEEDHEMGYEVLWHWFQNDRETLEEYNVEDCRIVKAIDEKYQLIRILFRICRRGYCRPSQIMYRTDGGTVNIAVGQACDSVILHSNRDKVFNNRGKYADLHDFPGGRVFEPKPGRYEDVMTADFSGMYPAIIRDFNVGESSWIDTNDREEALQIARDRWGDHVTEDDLISGIGPNPDSAYETEGQADNVGKARGFFIDPEIQESEIAGSLEGIESLRKEFKQKKKQASKGSEEWKRRNNQDRGLKVLANSMFGVAASPLHRFYEPGMSENITEIGQHLTSACKIWAEENLDEVVSVIYGDTDSVMFHLDTEAATVSMDGFDEYVADFIEEVGPDNELDMDIEELREAYHTIQVARQAAEKLNDFIVEYVREAFGSPGNHMEMDLDDVWIRYLITDKKKKYAGDVVYDDGPCAYRKIKGFRCIKANTSDAIVDFQKELIDALLHDEETSAIIERFRHELFTGQYDEQMIQWTRLGKMPSEYATLPAHGRAAKMIIEREGDEGAIRTGDKIQYLKYGDDPKHVMPTDNGIDDFRPNEGYCEECDDVFYDDEHRHDVGENPKLRRTHYSYLWEARFEPTMELLEINRHEQKSLGAYV